jgi:basic amino acid/polyamine antiporter, APA family
VEPKPEREFKRELGLFDATMIVAGAMIGSGIFVVSADMGRLLGSAGWLLAAWVLTGALTVAAALSYGELAAMMPQPGGQYVYLRESLSPLWGCLYGWTFILVIHAGTIAAVAVAFAKYAGVIFKDIGESNYLIRPIHITPGYAVSLSTAQLLAILMIALLTLTNMRGVLYGKLVQNVFTVVKTGALMVMILLGLTLGWNVLAVHGNFGNLWAIHNVKPVSEGLTATTAFGLFVAICVAQTGSMFAADAWHNVGMIAGEVRQPRRNLPLALTLGVIGVIILYLLANTAYLVTLPLNEIQTAKNDRVATAMLEKIFPGLGVTLMALAIMISTFGCDNSLILAGARTWYAMARDGLFFRGAGQLNAASVPAWGLVLQGIWAAALVLPRTFNTRTQEYGNLYSDLLDYVVSAALLFYVLTIIGLFRLRFTRPHAERPCHAFGYPIVPALYIIGAATILGVLLYYRPKTTWPGLVIVLLGVPFYFICKRRAIRSGSTAQSSQILH